MTEASADDFRQKGARGDDIRGVERTGLDVPGADRAEIHDIAAAFDQRRGRLLVLAQPLVEGNDADARRQGERKSVALERDGSIIERRREPRRGTGRRRALPSPARARPGSSAR